MVSMDSYSKALIEVATLQERERIIKIIEELRDYSIGSRKARQVDVLLPEVRYQRLIDRIKGENK